MKHTEGPWHVWNEQYPRVGPTHNCTVAGVFACPAGDQQANAKLLAAPEMLEALKSAMQCLDDFVGDGPTYRMVKAAIAKAEGVSVCDKCGDSLTGHEDDSRTRCRWCVTSQSVDASAVAQAAEIAAVSWSGGIEVEDDEIGDWDHDEKNQETTSRAAQSVELFAAAGGPSLEDGSHGRGRYYARFARFDRPR